MNWRVGYNLLFAVPGQVGGSEQYLCRQITSVLDAGSVAPTVYAVRGFAEAHPEIAGRCPVRVAPTSGRSRPVRVGLEATWLRRHVRASDVQLVHHGGGTVPAGRSTVPAVVTVHDLQYLTFPQTFSRLKLTYLSAAMPRSMRRAAVVTVPSEFVRASVLDEFGLSGDQVVVVPHPIGPGDMSTATTIGELRSRFGLRQRLLVLPAITYTHKNHATVVAALAELARPEVSLVLMGGAGPAEDAVMAQVARLGLGQQVLRPGRVSDADRNGLLMAADALVFPSRYEGFGAPVIEAMWAGCPVLAANATALSEVVADAGVLLPADDPTAWATSIARVLDDPDHRAELVERGHLRARWFSPARAAEALATAYGRALL